MKKTQNQQHQTSQKPWNQQPQGDELNWQQTQLISV